MCPIYPHFFQPNSGTGTSICLRRTTIEWISGNLEEDELWRDLGGIRPDLVICSDVIEHLIDPVGILNRLRSLARSGLLIISTPDRSHLEDASPLGPPTNPLHIREWTSVEMCRLVTDCGFNVARVHHLLPRSYSVSLLDLRIVVGRALRGLALPEPRSCQALELSST
ncbi:methyltransferase domain-containing protein [Parafrankia sp. FMc6]|uniref:class I SAM-dependent methyltransferase n=1 Tax=Parafrankia soli TaxID=2599596 RepID=UPI0034D48AFE